MKSEPSRSLALDIAACAFILLAHFGNYAVYLDYGRIFPDLTIATGIVFFISIAIGALVHYLPRLPRAMLFALLLVIIFGDAVFQYGTAGMAQSLFTAAGIFVVSIAIILFLGGYTTRILIAIFATVIVSSVLLVIFDHRPQPLSADSGQLTAKSTATTTQAPVVLHIILDEHAGLAAMTDDLPGGPRIRREIEAFFRDRGFLIFRNAFSQFNETAPSVAAMFNFYEGEAPDRFLTWARSHWVLQRNAYFTHLSELGYDIRVYQSGYLDYCNRSMHMVCSTYRHDGFDADTLAGLSLGERIKLLLRMYYSSIALVKSAIFLEKEINHVLAARSLPLINFGLWHGRVGPLAVGATVRQLMSDLRHATAGSFYFVHMLMPHYPYVYEENCTIRSPIVSWQMRSDVGGYNSQEMRRTRYALYFDQLRCTMKKVDSLLQALKASGIYESATVIVHSDHGSRISLVDSSARGTLALGPQYYRDNFSTLFAIKKPGVVAGGDDRLLPLVRLLRYSLSSGITAEAIGEPRLFLRTEDDKFRVVPLSPSGYLEPMPHQEN